MKDSLSKVPDIVQVVWKDSYGLGDDWFALDYAPEPRVMSTCGYRVAEDDEYIIVAATYDAAAEMFGTAIAVLKSCVLSSKTYTA